MKYLLILLPLLALSCKKEISCYPDKTLSDQQTLILAHKAGGNNGPFPENTVEAAAYGFGMLQGIETDIQKSRDGTLWLYHDETIMTCDGKLKRIPGLTDDEIRAIINCSHAKLNTLEELFQWHRDNHSTEYISLDVKSWLPTRYSNTLGYLVELADEIARLAVKYEMSMYLLTECENATFLKRIREKNRQIQCYLTTLGDFDNGSYRALKAGFDGISLKYEAGKINEADIALMHKKGLKIQLWTVNEKSLIDQALRLKPDFIQTDNLKLE